MSQEHRHQWDLESFRSLADTGKLAHSALLLVGGGASAALLSFVGVLSSRDGNDAVVASLMTALGWFYGALLLTVALSGVAYLAQDFYKTQAYAHSDLAAATERRDANAVAAATAEADRAGRRGKAASGVVIGLFVAAFVCLLIGGVAALTAGSLAARQHAAACPTKA